MALSVTSFGFKYGGGPNSVSPDGSPRLVMDVRRYFPRNPYQRADLRGKRGDDPEVARFIEAGPGFEEAYRMLRARVQGFPGEVWLGCTGGHHRSVYLAARIGRELGIPVYHRDKGRK